MSFASSRSTTTQTDARQIVGTGGVLITQAAGSGNLVASFRDENAVNAATELASRAVVSTQDIGALALRIAESNADQGQLLRLAVIGAMVVATAVVLRPALVKR